MNEFEARTDLSQLRDAVDQVKTEIGKVIVGQEEMIELLLAAILADGHALIEGVPGVAKTLTAKLIAKTVSVGFSRIQFTPDLMPSDVLGTQVFNQKSSEFQFKQGPIFSNIVLIDEINRSPAKTQAALFEVMEERQITVDGTTYLMDAPFLVLATQNPIDQEGTYRLPEAQLDRFLFKIDVKYPNLDEEIQILTQAHSRTSHTAIEEVSPVLTVEQIAQYRQQVKALRVDASLIRYIAQITNNTRNSLSLSLGASPRASLAILNTAKAIAAIRGRDFVTPEDIKRVTIPVLRHRVMLTPEREMEGVIADDIIKQILDGIEVPR
ncbi:MoxR family ATPase [Cytophagaceae bacterium DM2B3-1]|uniref:MoxR family ATPase n=1 Tax=Xanthocytophaga flava TaxID=3048013 RepID=A0ABT7CRR9_9BACT|nr:MoxR family ATPase [Xanthocytophaga flavus]MDJ1468805.1 MoxR family ATPase [Xanthocytophaga flavus]MDJ1495665.1 MoxR family ATPase [Xanthocytophaga flavus]